MSMRKWKRGVAKHRMELCGYDHMNRKTHRQVKTNKKGEERTYYKSAFAIRWRDILKPGTPAYKEYARVCLRKGTA